MQKKDSIVPETHATASAAANKQLSSSKSLDTKTFPVQYKLTVGSPDDPLESEADIIADKVMRMPAGDSIQRKCAQCEEEKARMKPLASPITPFIQTKSNGEGSASDAVSSYISSSRGNGSHMDGETKTFMESRFGSDFSGIKIHTGNESVQMNRELNAKAFTVGSDIYFNEGQYNTGSESGRHLLAHELTHTLQQGATHAIQKKKNNPPAAGSDLAENVVYEVYKASDGIGTDEERIFRALQTLNRDTAAINTASGKYKQKHGMSLEEELRDEMSGSELQYGLELIGIATEGEGPLISKIPETDEEFKAAARRLDNAVHPGWTGWGTDEETIYAVLLPFNKDSEKLKKLKLTYRDLTGDTLRADIIGDMSGKELSYALYLLNDEVDETSMELDSMLGKQMQWRSSGLYPCVNSVLTFNGKPLLDKDKKQLPCTSFGDWATASKQGPVPEAAAGTIINCWEVLLLASFNAGAIDWNYIHGLYTEVPACTISKEQLQFMDEEQKRKECEKQQSTTWKDKLTSGKLRRYEPGSASGAKPQRGDVVFFNGLEHVALATGTQSTSGSEVYSFWPAPDIPFIANEVNAVKDRVKKLTIEELNKWWIENKKESPVIEFAKPEW